MGPPTNARKRRQGVRIKHILQEAANKTRLDPVTFQKPQSGRVQQRMDLTSDQLQSRIDLHQHTSEGAYSDSSLTFRLQPRLLGIEGLSAEILETCIDAFFENIGIWMFPLEHHLRFKERFHLFLQCAQGKLVGEEEIGTSQTSPASELLVLAVAMRGCTCTRYSFLGEGITSKIAALLQEPDLLHREGLDGIEAVTLISELHTKPLHPLAPGGQQPSCFLLDPMGKGFPAEMCLFFKLNEEPSTLKGDYTRRRGLFWMLYTHDAVGSASAGRMYRIPEEEVGWPAMDGESAEKRPFIALAVLARRLCRTMLCQRAKRFGVPLIELKTILAAITDFPRSVNANIDLLAESVSSSSHTTPQQQLQYQHHHHHHPESLQHSSPLDQNYEHSSTRSSGSITSLSGKRLQGFQSKQPYMTPESTKSRSESPGLTMGEKEITIRQIVLLGFWLRLSISVWTAMQAFQLSPLSEEMILVEDHMGKASEQIVKLARICLEHDYVNVAPNILLGTFSACLLFLIHLNAIRNSDSPPHRQSNNGNISQQASILLQAIRSARSSPEASRLAEKLQQGLQAGVPLPAKLVSQVAERSIALLGEDDQEIQTEVLEQDARAIDVLSRQRQMEMMDGHDSQSVDPSLEAEAVIHTWPNVDAPPQKDVMPVRASPSTMIDFFPGDMQPQAKVDLSFGINTDPDFPAVMGNTFDEDDWNIFFSLCGVDPSQGTL